MHVGKTMWATMLAIDTSKGVAPGVNVRECISCPPPPSANMAAKSGFKTQKRHDQKSKTVVLAAPNMDMYP